jgi:hypothetical protein
MARHQQPMVSRAHRNVRERMFPNDLIRAGNDAARASLRRPARVEQRMQMMFGVLFNTELARRLGIGPDELKPVIVKPFAEATPKPVPSTPTFSV